MNAYHSKENIWCNVYNIVPYQYVQLILIHFHSYIIFHYVNASDSIIQCPIDGFLKMDTLVVYNVLVVSKCFMYMVIYYIFCILFIEVELIYNNNAGLRCVQLMSAGWVVLCGMDIQVCLSILLLLDIWVLSRWGQLWIELSWTFTSFCEHTLAFLLGKYPGVKLLSHMVNKCLTL